MKRIFLLTIAFSLCCSHVSVAFEQYSTPSFFEEESYIGRGFSTDESPFESYEIENPFGDNSMFSIEREAEDDCPPGFVWDAEFGECYDPNLGMDPDTPDPGGVPIGDSYGFFGVAVLLYGGFKVVKRKKGRQMPIES